MRPKASIVIPAWNEWELTRACLETLRPTMKLRDEVIVVDNGSVDDTAAGLKRYPWVKVVSHPENLGFAAGCNSGTAVATGDVVIFLNNDTLLPSRWLDGLLAPFADPSVGATGPRSNFVSGVQLAPQVAYDAARVGELQRFARAWRDEHRGQTSDVTRLVGFCLAVRRSLLEELGGFDEGFGIGGAEDDDLCLRIADAGHRLLVAHESFVHHHGHRTFEANGVDWLALQNVNLERLAAKRGEQARSADLAPVLLSACLIVKDEEENLPACLASLQGLVDEVVIYDTGSTDGTVALARLAGATVIEGYWDDNFSRARNSALEHCRGTWILHVDADEVISADVDDLRAQLVGEAPDLFEIVIDNLDDAGGLKFSHTAHRLFQRARAHWRGHLHEQVVPRQPGDISIGSTTHARIRHSGYTSSALGSRDKDERNLRVARLGAEADGGRDGNAVLNLGRALSTAGRYDEAVVEFARARQLATDSVVLRLSLRDGADALLEARRPAEALEWVDALRRHTTSSTMPDYLEGTALMDLGDMAGALARLEHLEEVVDENFAAPRHVVQLRRGLALAASKRWNDAAQALTFVAQEQPGGAQVWALLAEALWRAGKPVDDLIEVIDEEQIVSVLGQLLRAPAAAADPIVELLWTDRPGDPRLLAFAVQAARHLPLGRALDWSARIRSAGLDSGCPLVAQASDIQKEPIERLRAAATAFEAFGDDGGREVLHQVAASLEAKNFQEALLAVDELAPRLLPKLIEASATTRVRCLAMAEALTALGAEEQAAVVLAHAAA